MIMITIKRNYDEKDDDIDYVNDIGNGTDNLVSHLVLIGLEQDAHPVRVVVHGEVCEPGAGVRVDHDLVPTDTVDHNTLTILFVSVFVFVSVFFLEEPCCHSTVLQVTSASPQAPTLF